ncbi:MAG TPA: hypothetical protein VK892_12685 [Pyrinomonadaceae bacterium]|nr:hypothetical protein [Pyrinomonadaceae bacterium]
MRIKNRWTVILAVFLAVFGGTVSAQNVREATATKACSPGSALNGVYRIDVDESDRLYSVIEGASSNVPFAEQQQFFIDLAVRLTPPDLLAIECGGNRVWLGSSRSPRVEFLADGVARRARNSDGQTVRSRIGFERNSLIFNSSGSDEDLNFTFTPLDGGRRLRVIRRISARELIEPVVIQTVYNKISEIARWDIFDDNQLARQTAKQNDNKTSTTTAPRAQTVRNENNEAGNLRESLYRWIDATNYRDIEKQMSFYVPVLKAYYLTRNTPRNAVRNEKNRVFAAAKSIDIRAAEPEIIFQDGGRTAIMRFRKKYRVENGARSRSGEVIQELRWQQTRGGWKIFSERDIKVLR